MGPCCPHDAARPSAATIPSSRGTCQALPRRLLLETRTALLMSHHPGPAVPHLRPQHLIQNRQPSLAGSPQRTHLLRQLIDVSPRHAVAALNSEVVPAPRDRGIVARGVSRSRSRLTALVTATAAANGEPQRSTAPKNART